MNRSHDLMSVTSSLTGPLFGILGVMVVFFIGFKAFSLGARGQAGAASGLVLMALVPAAFIFDPGVIESLSASVMGGGSGKGGNDTVPIVVGVVVIVVLMVIGVVLAIWDEPSNNKVQVEKRPPPPPPKKVAKGPPPLTRWNGSPILASGEERERVVALLRLAEEDDRFDVDELERRAECAYSARTRADLASLVVDLPPEVGE